MIRLGVAAPNLAPRIGQEVVREQGRVSYRDLQTRCLLNPCDSARRMPFEWTVNPYRGCAMGCRYCYATYTHQFMGLRGDADFHDVVFVKRGGEDATARRLAAVVRRGERIALGTATDPYQPGEAEARVTRRFLELAAQHRGLRLGITTKGALVLRDLDLLQRIHERSRLRVHVSLTSLRADLLRELEPWAPPPTVRLEMLRRLHAAGIDVWLSLSPVLPGLTDTPADLDALLAAVSETGVRRMFSNVLFLRSPTREKYMAWLQQAFPDRVARYRAAYGERAYLKGPWRREIDATVERLRQHHGFRQPRGFDPDDDAPRGPAQLTLFG